MWTLSLETSTSHGSVALGHGADLQRSVDFEAGLRPSVALFQTLEQFGLDQVKLARIVVGIGPGSFSGIRVALAAAQAIATVQEIEVIGICSAVSVGMQLRDVGKLGVFADARRGEYYCTYFRAGYLDRGPLLSTREQLTDAASQVEVAASSEILPIPTERVYPRARDFVYLQSDYPHWVRQSNLEPIYLRGVVKG